MDKTIPSSLINTQRGARMFARRLKMILWVNYTQRGARMFARRFKMVWWIFKLKMEQSINYTNLSK